jgi:hypothetical protein
MITSLAAALNHDPQQLVKGILLMMFGSFLFGISVGLIIARHK